jgi:hypothetical protein
MTDTRLTGQYPLGGIMEIRKLIVALLILVCVPCFLNAAPPPIPNLSDWEAFMKDNKNMVADQPEHADR